MNAARLACIVAIWASWCRKRAAGVRSNVCVAIRSTVFPATKTTSKDLSALCTACSAPPIVVSVAVPVTAPPSWTSWSREKKCNVKRNRAPICYLSSRAGPTRMLAFSHIEFMFHGNSIRGTSVVSSLIVSIVSTADTCMQCRGDALLLESVPFDGYQKSRFNRRSSFPTCLVVDKD